MDRRLRQPGDKSQAAGAALARPQPRHRDHGQDLFRSQAWRALRLCRQHGIPRGWRARGPGRQAPWRAARNEGRNDLAFRRLNRLDWRARLSPVVLAGCGSSGLPALLPPLPGGVLEPGLRFGARGADGGRRGASAAETRGVEVRVITDPTVAVSRRAAKVFDALRIPERAYPVDDRRHQIDHVKLLIADGEAAVGGMNWGRHSDRNHDYVLETRNAIELDRLARIFDQDWDLAGGHPAPLPQVSGPIAQTSPGGEIRAMLEHVLNRVVHRVMAEVYTLTDAAVVAEMVIAHRRGAAVRVLLDPNQVYNLHAYAVLHAGGVEVRWYPVPKGVLLHAKIGLFDAELVLGSANWTSSGLGVNHELDIETDDAAAVQGYVTRFESDWARSPG
ncbi:MAG: phosphatidylserine/phosphatidylglycerophosphate/cardiolipin synthase family protein [Chloroflexi bacterium]|nr:MAG: phosphatidylserine/phosphatidylglycerophosphate/cardiolipin synthase family protein [Chloroflexota bacterium]